MQPKVSRVLTALLLLALAVPILADRTRLKPGFNIFSPTQDIEMGRRVSRDAEAQLEIFTDVKATEYVDALGKRLAAKAPGGSLYPFQFKIVNDETINAFALPGGFVYVNRGAIESANNEGQLAGVIAHEIGHVVLRHGTHQVSNAYVLQAPLSVLGAIGGASITSVLAKIGGGFTASSVLLRNSREAESQADLMGTQIIYDAGYDPKAMAQFFEILEVEGKQPKTTQFFANHPNPENRIGSVNKEIEKLGGAPPDAMLDSPEFQAVKHLLSGAPVREEKHVLVGALKPSAHFVESAIDGLQLRHPDNWTESVDGNSTTLSPDGGIVSGSLAYGMTVATYEPLPDSTSLNDGLDRLITKLHEANVEMDTTGERVPVRVDGQPGLSIEITNRSPLGGFETDLLVMIQGPDGRFHYVLGVAPQPDFASYRRVFDIVIGSVRFR